MFTAGEILASRNSLFKHLIAFIGCAWGFHHDISIYAYNVPQLGSPHHHSPLLPSPLFKTIATGFIVLFSHKYMAYIDQIHPPFPSLFTHPLPLKSTPPKQDLSRIPTLHFF
jgi:hypothetical protein